jgi:hypothetical protein
LEQLAETVEIRLGRRGDQRDRAVTLRELIDSGLAIDLASNPFDPNTLGNSGFVSPGTRLIDLAVPPAPTGFSANGAFSQVNLQWDYPAYANHNHTEVWRHSSDTVGDAILIGIQAGRIFVDPVGSGVTRYYWVRHVNTDGVIGPFNAASGNAASTATDVNHMLGVLTGAVTSSQLATSLSDPIGNLPADTNASISAEATARSSADTALSQSITTVSSTVAGHTSSISTQATSINGLSGQYTVKIDVNGAVAGYGLASTTTAAGNIVSEFVVNADRFALMRGGSNTATATVPFVVQASATTINGESVAAGVYMADAFIKNGSIANAKIGTLNADKITAGSIAAARIAANTIDASKLRLDNSTITSQTISGIPTVIIKDLGVGNAKIQNLAVSTLKIQDQAVTFPSAITTSSTVSFAGTSSGTTFSTIQTLTATYSGAPVLISGSFAVRSYDDQALMRFRLRRGSTVLFTSTTKAVRPSPETVFVPFNFLDSSTASGSRTYTLQAYVQDQFGYYMDRSIVTLEVKK